MRRVGWTALLVFAIPLACAGSAAQREPTPSAGAPEVRSGDSSPSSGPTDAPAPGTTASVESEPAEPVADPDPSPEPPAPDDGGASKCSKVCKMLDECTERPLPECNVRCMSSQWVAVHKSRCLANRIFWINEEGCTKMLETYDSFVGNDDCKH